MSALRPIITTPCDLALPGRLLRSALSCIDLVNPFAAVSQPAVLEFDALDREGQVAAFHAWRAEIADGLNARRRAAWRAEYGGHEALGQLRGVTPAAHAAVDAVNIAAAMKDIASAVSTAADRGNLRQLPPPKKRQAT